MLITVQGALVILLGLIFLRANPMRMLGMVLWLGVFSGAAAVVLKALGGSSINPQRVMIGFLLLQVIVIVRYRASILKEAIVDNAWLLIFAGWGAASAFLLPRMFAHTMRVVPMMATGMLVNIWGTVPLAPTSQNITQAVYIIGTAIAAILAYIVVRFCRSGSQIIYAGLAIGLTQIMAGLLNVLLPLKIWAYFMLATRNGAYAQLEQSVSGVKRISGFQPEPSIFAAYSFIWLVLCFELWLRDVMPRYTGAAALGLVAIVLLSTSSSGYLGIAAFAAIFGLRLLGLPQYFQAKKMVALVFVGVTAALAAGVLIVLVPHAAATIGRVVGSMTTHKLTSASGVQRTFWALEGYRAFFRTYGLGLGAGSLRASGFLIAVMGSMGIIGIVCLAMYCWRVLWHFGPKLTNASPEIRQMSAIADAFAMTMVFGLLPQLFSSPTADPGTDFAILGGAALAMRRLVRAALSEDLTQTTAPATRVFPRSYAWRQTAR